MAKLKITLVEVSGLSLSDYAEVSASCLPCVTGVAMPVGMATAVTVMERDIDDQKFQPVPVPVGPKWTFSFQLAAADFPDPCNLGGPHLLTLHIWDDTGELTEATIPFMVM